MPPKVLGHAVGMFYAELVQLFASTFSGPEIDTKGLEVNLDSGFTSANIMVTFKDSPNKLPAMKAKILALGKKYDLVDGYQFEVSVEREDRYSHSIDVRLAGLRKTFGDVGVDAMQASFKKHLGEEPEFLTVNY